MADVPYRPFNAETPAAVPMPYQRPAADPDVFGAATGRVLQGLGTSLQRNATLTGDALLKRQNEQDANLATDANTAFMEKATELYDAYQQKSGRDAYQGFPEFKKSLDDLWNQSVGGLQNEEAKRLFTTHTRRFYVASLSDGRSYANKEFRSWGQQAATGRADALANQASINIGNPAQMQEFLVSGGAEVRKAAEMAGKPPELADQEVREYWGRAVKSIVTLQAKDDPQAAMATLQKFGAAMDPESRAQAAATLRPIAREQEASAIVNTALGVQNPTGPRGSQAAGPQGFANNIGNLRASDADWIGKGSPYNGFETFSTPEQGVAAAVKNIQHIADVHGGSVSIADLITTWAPGSDGNDPSEYAATVAKAVGMDVDDEVPLDDPEKMTAFVKAMARVEKGPAAESTPDSAYTAGVRAALEGAPLPNASAPAAGPAPDAGPGSMPDKSAAYAAVLKATDGDPDLQAAALAKLNQQYAINDALTATARQQLADQLPDVMRAAQMGDTSVTLPLDLLRRAGLSAQEFSDTVTQFDAAKRIGVMTQGLAFASNDELEAAMAGAESLTGPIGDAINAAAGGPAGTGNQAMRIALQSGAISQIKKMQTDRQQMLFGDNADPARYVAAAPMVQAARQDLEQATMMASRTNDPGIAVEATQAYAAAVLGQQAALGVAPENQRVLSREQATRLGQALSPKQGQSGEMAVQMIRDGARAWGGAWPQIATEIGSDLAPVARVVSIMPVSQNHAAAQLVEAAGAQKDLEKVTQGAVNTDIKESVASTFGDFMATFRSSGLTEGLQIMAAGELLARSHVVRDGMKPDDAAAQAYREIVGSQYDVSAGVRVPIPYDADLIVRGGDAVANGLTVDDVMPPIDDLRAGDATGEQYLSSLKANHYWVNAPNGKGLVLMDQVGPVLDKSGQPFYRSWQQLIATEPMPAMQPMPGSQLRDPATLPSAGITTLMSLTPQEQFLYNWHVNNITGRNGGKSFTQPNGAVSTILQMVEPGDLIGGDPGKWYNIPSVWDGKPHSEDQAIEHAKKIGAEKWPSYATQKEAQDRYDKMHEFMEKDVK